MRVYVKTNDGKTFWIPVPDFVLNFATGKFAERMAYKHVPEKDRKYLECVDFRELRCAIKILKEYKGLEIVNVNAKDGTKVSIKL